MAGTLTGTAVERVAHEGMTEGREVDAYLMPSRILCEDLHEGERTSPLARGNLRQRRARAEPLSFALVEAGFDLSPVAGFMRQRGINDLWRD